MKKIPLRVDVVMFFYFNILKYFILFLLVNFSTVEKVRAASVEYKFNAWNLESAQKNVEEIKQKNSGLTEVDIKRAIERAATLKSSRNYEALPAEIERQISKTPESYDLWLELAEAHALAMRSSENKWDHQYKGKLAAIKAFQLAKTNIEKGQALLIYGDTEYEGSEDRAKILTLITSNEELKKVKSDPRFKDFIPFIYSSYELVTNTNVPEVRFIFSQPIQTDRANDYIDISPKVDGKVTVVDREIRVTGFAFSTTYDVTIKAGLKSKYGDVLQQPAKIGVKVTEQNARLSFKNQKFILQKTPNLSVPLESVNVDKVQVKIVRLADKVLAGNMTRPFDATFLKNLYSNEFKHIKNVEGAVVFDQEMILKGERNKTQTTHIPLQNIEKDLKPGAYVVYVADKSAQNVSSEATQWVMISDIGLTTFMGENGLNIDVRKLSTTEPQKGIRVDLVAHNQEILATKNSDEAGKVFFEKDLLQGKDGHRPLMIACYGEGGEFTLLDLTKAPLDLSDLPTSGREVKESEDLYIYLDRGVYRPGEVIHFHALLRDHALKAVPNAQITFKLLRPDGVMVKQDNVQGNDVGFFEHQFQLLESAHTGLWTVQGFLDPKAKTPLFETKVSVEDFTPARMTVSVTAKDQNLTPAKSIEANIKAQYLFGGVASNLNAEAVFLVNKHPNPFSDYKNFVFGNALDEFTPQRIELPLTGLDDKGQATVAVDGKTVNDASVPLQGQLRINVFDRGGRPQLGTTKINIFTKPFYIGIKQDFERISGDESEASFEIIAVGEGGKLQAIPNCAWKLSKETVEYSWYQSGNTWRYSTNRTQDLLNQGTIALNDKEPAKFTLKDIQDWGDYVLEIGDFEKGLVTKIRFSKGWSRTDRLDVPDLVKMRLDKESYNLSEEMTINVESPISGKGLLTVTSHAGVLYQENVVIQKGQATLKLKVKPEFGIGGYIILNAFRKLAGDEKDRALPIRVVGLEWFKMDTSDKTLKLALSNKPFGKPREAFSVDINVEDAKADDPVYLSLAAVDEGILLLTDYKNPDPIQHFFGKKKLNVELRDLYGYIIENASGQTGAFHTGGDEGALARNLAALSKKSFKIISLYSGLVYLQNGKATIPFEMPDFNGKVRLICVAASKNKVGAAVSAITIKDPVILETVLPKFLAPKDQSQMIISVHNQSEGDEQVKITLKSEGVVKLEKEELNIQIAKDAEQVFQIPMSADAVGDSTITLTMESKSGLQEYVYEISTREGKAFKSEHRAIALEKGKILSLSSNDIEGFIPETARMILAFSKYPWNVKHAAKSLSDYPYGCIEQSVSRGFGLLYLRNEDKERFDPAINDVIAKIAQDQDLDGSFDLWRGSNSERFNKIWLSSYVLDFLVTAQKAGFSVPNFTLDNLKTFLKDTLRYMSTGERPEYYQATAYCLYALSKADGIEPGDIRYFYDTFNEKVTSAMGRSFLIQTLASYGDEARLKAAISKFNIEEKIHNSPYGTELRDFIASYKVLLSAAKQSQVAAKELEQKLPALMVRVRDMIATKRHLTTQENAWICMDAANEEQSLALTLDGQTIDSKEPVYKEYLGTNPDHKFENRSENPAFAILTISGQKIDQKAEASGFKVSRKFFNLEGQEIQKLDLTQGQTVVVILDGEKMTIQPHQLLLVDMLPAGVQLEPLPQLPWVGETTKLAFSSMRDDRYVASFQLGKDEKNFKVAYLVRAITLGSYTYPGSFVEDMYDTHFFAQNEATKLSVIERKVEAAKK